LGVITQVKAGKTDANRRLDPSSILGWSRSTFNNVRVNPADFGFCAVKSSGYCALHRFCFGLRLIELFADSGKPFSDSMEQSRRSR
jgi:hypothetical protein